jgi:hypothetical protein
MTEDEIIKAGFIKTSEHGIECTDSEENKWHEDPYHYYTYQIAFGLEFITSASDEVLNENEWYIEVFNTSPTFRFTDISEFNKLIGLLKPSIVKKTEEVIMQEQKNKIYEHVHEYSTVDKYGFTKKEFEEIIALYPKINMDKVKDAMMGNTCKVNRENQIIYYHRDVFLAIVCGVQNRNLKVGEWD